ncbi:hypothetical protein DN752_07340 [Echinicola strongylocentroti]|uniref:Uncharacterized protein n=1 Tax=Echinicola strongylocentroti TaxID=1795355 RepID=A0A2Z4IH05_9BACT|nr:hypothetical protein DN752_07340 [Echinicola strongylocentroti]
MLGRAKAFKKKFLFEFISAVSKELTLLCNHSFSPSCHSVRATAVSNVQIGAKCQRHDKFCNLRIHPQELKHSSAFRRSASGTDDSRPTRN